MGCFSPCVRVDCNAGSTVALLLLLLLLLCGPVSVALQHETSWPWGRLECVATESMTFLCQPIWTTRHEMMQGVRVGVLLRVTVLRRPSNWASSMLQVL